MFATDALSVSTIFPIVRTIYGLEGKEREVEKRKRVGRGGGKERGGGEGWSKGVKNGS